MPKLLLIFLLAGTALPIFAAKRVTVEQLDQVLVAARGVPDGKIAEQLSGLELSERLSAARFSRWQAVLPGPQSRQSLLVLADESAFLLPPAAEIPATPRPSLAAQQQIIALAARFAKKTISRFPDFFAARQTLRFADTPADFRDSSKVIYQPLHLVNRSRDTVLYRKGREVVDLPAAERRKYGLGTPGLSTSGIFGPVLGMVLMDIAHGTLAWSHWEQGAAGPLVVFRYQIPRAESHYEVELSRYFQDRPAYHGEFSVDPASGAILRLTIEAELKPSDPIARSGILVEYGPVQIGGKTYICPLKSVSILLAPTAVSTSALLNRVDGFQDANKGALRQRMQTSLNDVAFAQYHVFRSESRVLAADNIEPAGDSPASETQQTQDTVSIAASENPAEQSSAQSSAPQSPVTTSAAEPAIAAPQPLAPATAVATATLSKLAAPLRHVPEPSTGTLPAPTIRVTSRIVYVDVVVRDRHGNIVRGLKQNDFKVSEDDHSQKIDYFRAFAYDDSTPTAQTSSSAPTARNAPTNTSAASTAPGTVNMILFDLLDTSLSNQAYARTQMLKFLADLPPGHKIALFILTDKLQMLQNVTGNSELLAEAARLLMPRAARLFQSNTQQMRSLDILGTLPSNMKDGSSETSFAMHLVEEMSYEQYHNGQMRNSIVNSAFHELAQATASYPGRKNLFWLSESFPLGVLSTVQAFHSPLGPPALITGLSNDLAASGTRIAIYPISLLGIETGGVTAAMNGTVAAGGTGAALAGGGVGGGTMDVDTSSGQPGGATGGPRMPDTLGQQSGARVALTDQMESIAEQTGGEAFVGTNDIAGALRRGLDAGENYYSLVYAPTDHKWNGKLRKIHVEMKHKGYTLSYRKGYVALPDPPAASGKAQR
ncbi:MAG TPA: VWA domain-containing protein [Terracidiphilus sp.]|nr:VWA domain-containing protein [Terracidiphilus sp.]